MSQSGKLLRTYSYNAFQGSETFISQKRYENAYFKLDFIWKREEIQDSN